MTPANTAWAEGRPWWDPLLPVLALGHTVAVAVDGGEDLQEQDVLPGREELRQGFRIVLLLRRRAEREARLPKRDVPIRAVGDVGVGHLILAVESRVQLLQDLVGIDKPLQFRPLEEVRRVALPALPVDQVVVEGPVLVRLREVQGARADRALHVQEQQGLVQRHPEGAGRGHGGPLHGLQEVQGRRLVEVAVLDLEVRGGVQQSLGLGLALEAQDLEDRAHPLLELQGLVFQDVVVLLLADLGLHGRLQRGEGLGIQEVLGRAGGEEPADLRHLLRVAERHVGGDGLDRRQGSQPGAEVAPLLVLPKRAVVRPLHAGQEDVDQVVLEPVVLVSEEGKEVQVSIRGLPARELEDLGPDDTLRKIADAIRGEPQPVQHKRAPLVEGADPFQVGGPLLDLGGLGRLRQPLQQRQGVGAGLPGRCTVEGLRLREQGLQQAPGLRRQHTLDGRRQLVLPPVDAPQDQFAQPGRARHGDLLANQQVDAAPEDQLGLELEPDQPGDLRHEPPGRGEVEGAEPVEGEEQGDVALAGPIGVRRGQHRLGRYRELLGDGGEVPRVEVPAGEDALHRLEIPAGHEKAHLGGRGLEALRQREEVRGKLEMPLPLGAREDGRRIESVRLHRVENPHAGHHDPPTGLGTSIPGAARHYSAESDPWQRVSGSVSLSRGEDGGECDKLYGTYPRSKPCSHSVGTRSVSLFVPLLEFNHCQGPGCGCLRVHADSPPFPPVNM
jgi:hypothetical protein